MTQRHAEIVKHLEGLIEHSKNTCEVKNCRACLAGVDAWEAVAQLLQRAPIFVENIAEMTEKGKRHAAIKNGTPGSSGQ